MGIVIGAITAGMMIHCTTADCTLHSHRSAHFLLLRLTILLPITYCSSSSLLMILTTTITTIITIPHCHHHHPHGLLG